MRAFWLLKLCTAKLAETVYETEVDLSVTESLLEKRESALKVETALFQKIPGMLVQEKENQAWCAYISLCNAEYFTR